MPERVKKEPKLTLMQKKAVDNRLSGMSKRKASIIAGYSEETASHASREIFMKPAVQAYINKLGGLLEDNGVTDLVIVRGIKKGLRAKGYYGKDAVERNDYKTRLDYLKYASELKGHKVNEKIDVNVTNNIFLNARKKLIERDTQSNG